MSITISQILFMLRKKAGETQEEVAKAVGVSRVTYTRYENGTRSPQTKTVIRIARHFNLTVEELFEMSLPTESKQQGNGEMCTVLRVLREERGLTQQAVADYLSITCSEYVSIETGCCQMRSDVIVKLADYYGVSADAILGRHVLEHRSVIDNVHKKVKEDSILADLSAAELQRVQDFVAGLKGSRK